MLGLIEIIGASELKLESQAGRFLFFKGKPCNFEEQRDSNGHNACQFLRSLLENTGMAGVTIVFRLLAKIVDFRAPVLFLIRELISKEQ